MAILALCIVGALLAVAQAGEVPTLKACESSVANMDAKEFVASALGGSAKCMEAEDKTPCCDQILGLFGEGGPAEFCMCNADFFSALLMVLSGDNKIDSTTYVDMLEECGVPVSGGLNCPGAKGEGPIEPKVQSQLFGTVLLPALLRRRTTPPPPRPRPTPRPSPTPAPTPTPTPAPTPAGTPGAPAEAPATATVPAVAPAAGKKAKTVQVVPSSKKGMK